jgi:hemerythrin superfamily protein
MTGMDAIELLKDQHRQVEKLFAQIEKSEDSEHTLALFEELADSLAAHSAIEEEIFYPAAYAKQTKELLQEAVEEHLSVKRVLADLLELTPEDESFDAKIKVLKEQVEHHVKEEEGELFKKVKKELGKDELETLGAEMEEQFEAEMADDPSSRIPGETDEAAPIR